MNVNELAELAWDSFMGSTMPDEAMSGFNTPEDAINAYCDDWPFDEVGPDDELDEFIRYTPRQLLVIYLENQQ